MKCNLTTLLALAVLAVVPDSPADFLDLRQAPIEPTLPAAAPRSRSSWPPPAPPPSSRYIPRFDDDQPGRWLQLEFQAVALRLDAEELTDWNPNPASERYALEWTHRWTPSVRLGIADAPRQLVPNLDSPAWEHYLTQLGRQFGSRLQLLLDDDGVTRPDAIRILGHRTRVLRFELAPEEPGELPHLVTQVFVETARGVLVFACEGPAPDAVRVDRSFESLLLRSERVP